MNDELQKQLADMLAKLSTAAQQGATWAGDQIPPLVQEKILYGRVSTTVFCVLWIIGAYVAFRFARRFYDIANDENTQDGFGYAIASIVASLCSGVASIMSLITLNNALLVWFAPRLYIIEWLADLVHGQAR